MKKFLNLFFLITIVPALSFAQSLDKSFIDALPQNIKDDVISQINQNISSNPVSEASKDYESFESNLNIGNFPDEELEKDFSNLRLFGQDFFRSFPSSFMPINDPAANDNYILDTDDLVLIQILGPNSKTIEQRIDRRGSIFISNIGEIVISGLTISDASKLLNQYLKDSFVEQEAIISLKKVRDIQVLITGEVRMPGVYTLGGYSTILNAISSSGGIKDSGSFREVILKRQGEIIQKIDLYDLFINADTSDIKSLRSGDSILVQPSNNQVRVVGAINRPAIFEFKQGEKVSDLIGYAGGFSNESDQQNFLVSRRGAKENILLYSNKSGDIELLRNDKIFVPYREYKEDNLYLSPNEDFATHPVKISGAVRLPGRYFIQEGEKLSELITKAGGYRQDAYPFAASLINLRAKLLESNYNEKLYNEAIKSIASLSSVANNLNISSLTAVLSEFKNTPTSGRVVAEFDQIKLSNDLNLDTRLSPGDEIYVPYYRERIFIFGEVLNPGTLKFSNNKTLTDYINLAGGFNKYADLDSLIIVQPNGESSRARYKRFGSNKDVIYPGTVIYIPRDLTYMEGTDLARTIAPIFSSLAISLASLNSISNN